MAPSASACATPRACAPPPPGRSAATRAASEDGGATDRLAAADSALTAAAGVDPELDALAERAGALAVELADLGSELRSYLEGIEAEPGRLEVVEERLAAMDRLRRKHGGTVESVLAHAEHCRTEIERLENASELAGELEARLATATDRRAELAAGLSASRAKAAEGLAKRVARGAGPAGDGRGDDGGRASSRTPTASARVGAETVELLVATNPGIPVSPLRDAASGGELSAGDAGAERARPGGGRRRRSSSTRSTRGSAATPPGRWGRGCATSARAAR